MKSPYLKKTCRTLCYVIFFCVVYVVPSAAKSRLDYMGSDQTYDKISGTFVSDHVPWARPLAGRKLNAVFIAPTSDMREVVELAQRLEMNYKVIMTAKRDSFTDTNHAGRHAVPQYSKLVLKLAKERLHPSIHYDLIFICKFAWKALPGFIRKDVLERVKNGAGLVYIESSGMNESIKKSLPGSPILGIVPQIYSKLPINILPLTPVKNSKEALEACKKNNAGNYRDLKGGHKGGFWNKGRAPLTCEAFLYGKGKIVVIDYYEGKRTPRKGNSLTPSNLIDDMVQYDFYYALISQFALWASGRDKFPQIKLAMKSGLTFTRSELDKKEVSLELLPGKEPQQDYEVFYKIRASDGKDVKETSKIKKNNLSIPLFPLPGGSYLLDIWLKDEQGQVIDYASLSFFVKAENDIVSIKTAKNRYREGETVNGTIKLLEPPKPGESVEIYVKDTWGREVLKRKLKASGREIKFSFPVKNSLSSLWDIYATISDKHGVVKEASCYIGIPNYKIDNYLFSQFYGISSTPLKEIEMQSWPEYGINCAYPRSERWYGRGCDSEAAVRHNFRIAPSVFPNGFGGSGGNRGIKEGKYGPINKNCLLNISQATEPQLRNWKKWVDSDAKVTSRFGTVTNWICAENFLEPNTCFCVFCVEEFRKYLKKLYSTVESLNKEYGTSYKSFDDVVPLPEPTVFEKSLIPMWLDHKMFMLDMYTDMYRKAAKRLGKYHDKVRASTIDMWFVNDHVGGVSPFDWPEMFKDVDSYANELHNYKQWEAFQFEMAGSFSNENGLQIARLDPWWFWETEHWKMQIHPWWNLFHGIHMTAFHYYAGMRDVAGACTPLSGDMSQPMKWFEILTDNIKAVQQGPASLLIQSERVREPIAIVISTVNNFASLLAPLDETSYAKSNRDFFVALQAIGLTPEFVGQQHLSSAFIKQKGYKALLLPYNRAMSDKTANVLRDFVRDGGLLIAGDKPGTMDEHCKSRTKSILADMFPDLGNRYYVKDIQEGHAVYMGKKLQAIERKINNRDFSTLQGFQEMIEKYSGVVEKVRLLDADGLDRRDIFASYFKNGDADYLCLLREPNIKTTSETGAEVNLLMKKKYHVYDILNGAYLGFSNKFKLSIPQYKPKMLSLLPYAPTMLNVNLKKQSVLPGQELPYVISFDFKNGDGVGMGLCVRIEVKSSDGKLLNCYTRNPIVKGSSLKGVMPVSLNAKPGTYLVYVNSISTGHRAEAYFEIKKGSGK